MEEELIEKRPTDDVFSMFHLYSLTGYNSEGIMDEVFLIHEDKYQANQFESMVINSIGKLSQQDDYEQVSVHHVAKQLEKKFGFRRYSFLNCNVWDKERNILCHTSIRG